MPIVQAGDVFGIFVRGKLNSQRVITTFYYRVLTPPDAEYDDLVWLGQALSAFDAGPFVAYRNLVNTSVAQLMLRGQFLLPTRGNYLDRNPLFNTGNVAGTCLPSINSTRITRLAFRPGRKGQGRVFLPGLGADKVSASLYTAAWQTEVTTQMFPLLVDSLTVLTTECKPVIYHGPGVAVDELDHIRVARVETEVSPQAQRRVNRGE